MDKVSIELTKQQWEEIYQWYLIVKDDYRMEESAVEAGEKIKRILIAKFGRFS
jgi:hypothetical protein